MCWLTLTPVTQPFSYRKMISSRVWSNGIDQLPDKQSEILARRFGLRGFDSSTLEDVGKEVGLTRERVRQIQIEALKKLKRLIEREGLNLELLFS